MLITLVIMLLTTFFSLRCRLGLYLPTISFIGSTFMMSACIELSRFGIFPWQRATLLVAKGAKKYIFCTNPIFFSIFTCFYMFFTKHPFKNPLI